MARQQAHLQEQVMRSSLILMRVVSILTLFGVVASLGVVGPNHSAWAHKKTRVKLEGSGWEPSVSDSDDGGHHGSRPHGSTGVEGSGYTESCIGPAPKNPDNWNPECKPADPKGPSSWELAQRANNLLPVPKPLVRTAPPRGKRELVGIPTWFWLDKTQWAERSATAKAGGVSATVTASAYQIVVDPGDGSDPFTCGAPWIPYADGATSDCTHAYTHSGRYTVTVTADWGADWTGSDGNGGTLPTIGRTVRFGVDVVQARSELIANP